MPTEQHQIARFGVPGGEVDEAAVEILHLHAGRLELRDDEPDLVCDLLDVPVRLLYVPGIEASAVPRDLAPDLREPLSAGNESPARGDQPFYERRDDAEGIVRFLLAEEAHTC